jgi:hypothetical protein
MSDTPPVSATAAWNCRRWIFVFGFRHRHPETKQSLSRFYVVLDGTFLEARFKMIAMFGDGWEFQYNDDAEARDMIKRQGLEEIQLGPYLK